MLSPKKTLEEEEMLRLREVPEDHGSYPETGVYELCLCPQPLWLGICSLSNAVL